MSRETDSSSSGPQGRGGAAYPSGTPPYGTRQYPQEDQLGGDTGNTSGTEESRPQAPAREPKTETRLTTRVRINIPGSRPIPPVVVRTAVTDTTPDRGGRAEAPPAPAAKEPPGAEATQAMPRWTPPGPSAPAPGAGTPPAAPTGGTPAGGEAHRPPPSDWFAPRKPPGATGQMPTVPEAAGTPPFGSPAGPGAGGTPPGGSPAAPSLPNIPYLTDSPTAPPAAPGESPFHRSPGGHAAPGGDPFGTDPYGLNTAGAEPFGGPATGPVPGADAPAGQGPGRRTGPSHGSVPFSGFHTPDPAARPHLGDAEPPAGPAGPAADALRPPAGGAPESRSGYRPPRGAGGAATPPGADDGPHVSGDTLVSGVPPVSSGSGARSTAAPKAPAAAAKPARKGRSKPMLLVGGVLSVVAVAYGAGLLMDHADVPNGTTVLGVDIGGDSKEQATKILDAAVDDHSDAPLSVEAGGQVTQLRPELAGLGIDPDATIQEVVHRDYNPMSVIGSLFGGTHEVAPVFTVDQAKLRSQLQTVPGGGTGSDGMVKFVAGVPVAVRGRTYQAIDADAAMQKITDAYEQRAESGSGGPVVLPVTMHRPTVTQAALEQAIKSIGDPAMSGRITVVAGSREVPFSPQKSLSKILTIVPVPGGGMALHIDLAVLQSLYGNAFQGVLLERGDGSRTPVTPQDVASAMLPELSKTAPAKTAVISNVAP